MLNTSLVLNVAINYEDKLKDFFLKKTGGDLSLFVKPSIPEETLEVYKLLTRREPINALLDKPVDETKSDVLTYYIGFKFHLMKKYSECDKWMKVSYNKGCEKALLFLINKYEDVNQEKWIQLCLIGREKKFEFCNQYFNDNLIHILVSIIHIVEHGNAKLLPVFIELCLEKKDFASLMLLSHLKLTKKVVLTEELKNILRVQFDKLSQIFSDPYNIEPSSSPGLQILPETVKLLESLEKVKIVTEVECGTDTKVEECKKSFSSSGSIEYDTTTESASNEMSNSSEFSESEDESESEEESDDEKDQNFRPSVIIQSLRKKFGLE